MHQPSYKLGTGRINLFLFLTDPVSPSVVMTNKTVSDHNDLSFINGDIIYCRNFYVHLSPTSALNVTVTPLSSYANIDNTTALGVINTFSKYYKSLDPFTFKLTGSIPNQYHIDFKVDMSDGTYQGKTIFLVCLLM